MRAHRALARSALSLAPSFTLTLVLSLALSLALVLALTAGLAGMARAQGVECNSPLPAGSGVEKEIVVIVDGSGSISMDEWRLQQNALLQALDSPVTVPRDGTIAIGVVQASPLDTADGGDPILAQVEVCLTQLSTQARVDALKNAISRIGQIGNGTSEGAGLLVGAELLFRTGDPATQERRLCVLTDGVANSGPSAIEAAASLAPDVIERISVAAVGQAQGGLDAPTAESFFGPVVRGGGQLTHATSHPEFLALFPENCLADPVGLRAFEVNQSVQDWQDSVPLVEDKPTIARVFLESLECATDPAAVVTTSGRLTATRDGTALPGAILPFNQGARAYLDCVPDDDRELGFRSLNFRLPPEWLSGDVTLSLEMPGGIDCGSGIVGERCDEVVSFEALDFPDVDFLAVPSRILYDPRNPTMARPVREPTIDDLLEQEARVKAMLPVAEIIADLEFFDTGLPTEGAQWRLDTTTSTWKRDRVDEYVLENVKWYFWKTRCTLAGGCPTDRLHAVTMGNDGVVGLSNPEGIRSSISALISPGGTDNVPLGTGHHRNSAVHELVHNFGFDHTANETLFGTDANGFPLGPCGAIGPIGGDPFPHIAYFPALDTATDEGTRALIGPLLLPPITRTPDDEIWGVATNIADWRNSQQLAIANPETDWALMSYCDLDPGLVSQDWISITNYQKIVDLLRTTDFDAPLPVGITDVDVEWVIRGNIADQLNDIGLFPFYQAPAPGPIELEPGPYTAELLDASGAVLESASFATTLAEPDEPEDPSTTAELDGVPSFFVTLPDPTTPVAEVVIRRGNTELSRVAASAAAPVVSIIEPAPGASLDGETVRFAWEATDADGDALYHAVDYSRDGGTTWVPLAVDLTEPSLEVGRQWLRAGVGAVFRVTTTDGFRSTTVVSAPFGVANNPPTVVIRSPGDGQRFGSAQRVYLDAAAFDREDGRLDGDAVEWISSRNGSLGFGARLEVGAETLAEGEHLLAARAVDAEDAPGAAVARILVSRVPESVVPEPDFSLRMDPPAQPINPGEEAVYLVYLTSLNGFDEAVTLEVLDLPPGWSANLDPAVVTPDGQSILVVQAPADATETAFPIIVQGTSGDLVHTTSGTADLVFGLIPQCFGRIAGVVSDAYSELPIEGARVRVASRDSETDVAGYYLTQEIGPRTDWRVEVSAPGYYTRSFPNRVVRCDDVTTLDALLVPIRTGVIMGQVVVGVVDESGAVTPTDTPIAEAIVSGAGGFVSTDATGHYARADVPLVGGTNAPQTHRFTAGKDGFWDADLLATVSMEAPTTLDFALVERCLVTLTGSGQAVDEFGQPVAGVPVGWNNVTFPGSESVVSGFDGRFELPEVTSYLEPNNAPRVIGITVSRPPNDPFAFVISQNEFTVEECGEVRLDGFEAVIGSGFVPPEENFARLQGTFRDDETGEPLPDVRYYVLRTAGGFLTTQLRGGSDGTYEVEIEVGVGEDTSEEVYVGTNPIETHWGVDSEPFVAEADQTYVHDVLMSAVDFTTIEGFVRDRETGEPVADARVDVQGGRNRDAVFTDASGFYTTQAYPGELNTPTFLFLSAFRQPPRSSGLPWYYFSQVQRFVEPGQTIFQDFDLLRECDGGAISGVVVNAETLEPLEDATVEIVASPWEDQTDVDGRFRLEGIWPRDGNQPRQVEVRASKVGFVTATRTVTVFCGAEIFLEFGTPSGGFGAIFGTVTDASTGEPLEGVFVGSGYGAADTTDELGQYAFDNAPLAADGGPRLWSVTATYRLDQQSAEVQVEAGAPARQNFAFATQPALGLAVDDEHTAFDPATRTLTSRSTLTVTNTTDETIVGPVSATILIDRAGVSMPDADGSDASGRPVFIVVEDGLELAVGASTAVELVFVRPAALAFLYDVQLALGDPRDEGPVAVAGLSPLAVWPAEADSDGDGWHDELDDCPTRPDPEQRDDDGDGVGDACQDLAVGGGAGDSRPPAARADWIRLSGTAPAGAVRVELGAASAAIDAVGRFEIESPVAATEARLELVFVDAEGGRDVRAVTVQAVAAATGGSR